MRMGSYFVESYATKILPVFLYIPHHRTSGFWKCLSRHVWAENPLFFQGKKLLPDVGIFRKISRIRKQPGFDVLFLLCLCVSVFFFFLCVFFSARARGTFWDPTEQGFRVGFWSPRPGGPNFGNRKKKKKKKKKMQHTEADTGSYGATHGFICTCDPFVSSNRFDESKEDRKRRRKKRT